MLFYIRQLDDYLYQIQINNNLNSVLECMPSCTLGESGDWCAMCPQLGSDPGSEWRSEALQVAARCTRPVAGNIIAGCVFQVGVVALVRHTVNLPMTLLVHGCTKVQDTVSAATL